MEIYAGNIYIFIVSALSADGFKRQGICMDSGDQIWIPVIYVTGTWKITLLVQILNGHFEWRHLNNEGHVESMITRALIHFKDAMLSVLEIPFWLKDSRKIISSPQRDFLYW